MNVGSCTALGMPGASDKISKPLRPRPFRIRRLWKSDTNDGNKPAAGELEVAACGFSDNGGREGCCTSPIFARLELWPSSPPWCLARLLCRAGLLMVAITRRPDF